jgi:hypothetical protein
VTFVDPASQTAFLGSDFTVNISIQNVTDLGSYEWLLAFDPALIDFVSVVDGPFLGSTGRTVFCPSPILDVGSVRFGCSTLGTTPLPPSGAGVLSTVTLRPLAEGTSLLDLVWVSLSDPLAADIPTAVLDGSVTLAAAPTPTLTPTATPTTVVLPQPGEDVGPLPTRETGRGRSSRLSLAPRLLGGLIALVGASYVLRGFRRPGRRWQ